MTQARDYDDDIDALIDAAEAEARTGKEQDFVADMRDKYDEYGEDMYLSERQYEWLSSIADRG